MIVGQPTLDQLRIFVTVVDEGSFNAAARKLGRAVSVISYGITQLETQLAVLLFDREGSRRPRLTENGRALLAHARSVINESDGLMAHAASIQRGLEAEIGLVVDVMVPIRMVTGILHDFQIAYPDVHLRLHVEALGAVADRVRRKLADLALAGPDRIDLPELEREALGRVEMVPVAASSHPLAQEKTLTTGMARQHLQLVLTDRSSLTEGREFFVFSPRSWRLADLGAKRELLREGIGWGYMPRHAVEDELASGQLVALPLPEAPQVDYTLHALWRKDRTPGPATKWLLGRFAACLNA